MNKFNLNFLKRHSWALLIPALVFTSSCNKDDEPDLGDPPTAADAAFTYQPSASSPNVIEFTADNPNIDASWDFGNGASATGSTATASYPFAGTYTVTLTVQNSGGSASSSQDVVIAQDDPTLVSNPLYDFLTGGSTKTWVIDSTRAAHMGVGPNPSSALGDTPEWWAAGALEKTTSGLYNDKYTFSLQGFGFDMETGGDVYVNGVHAGIAPFDDTASSSVGDFTAQFPDQMGENWTLTEGSDTMLTISGDAMIGYWAGTREYKIVKLDSNELTIRYVDGADDALAWYIRLVPVDYPTDTPEPTTGYSLPINFETEEPTFTTFGNSAYQIIDNPDKSGINTSDRVLETTHGNETWAGLFVDLENPLDFSTNSTITLKVWAPAAGTFRMKLEEQANPNSFVEVDVNVTAGQTWEELTFDFSGQAATFDRLVIFPGWGTSAADNFYIDDITQP